MSLRNFFARKKIKRLKSKFGETPVITYFSGDLENIRTYSDFRKQSESDVFMLDEITWNDLGMNDVFKLINRGMTSPGEGYLYYMLRTPAVEEEVYSRREELISLMHKSPETRINTELELLKLGRRRSVDVSAVLEPKASGWRLALYILMCGLLIASGISIFFVNQAVYAFIAVLIANNLLRTAVKKSIERELLSVNYASSVIKTTHAIKKTGGSKLKNPLANAFSALDRLKGVLRIGGAVMLSKNTVQEYLSACFLVDLITYELLAGTLARHSRDVMDVYEGVGLLDAAAAIASYRERLAGEWASPQIRFNRASQAFFRARDMRHPFIENAVPNSIDMDRAVLLTGSNASGKSTFLKVAAVSAIMAQGICTAVCSDYEADAFHIFTSMAISDSIEQGDSYYISEIKSLKRILDFTSENTHVFCCIDEVLRGTNTVERIAASSELLGALSDPQTLCIAATHDIELCRILADKFEMKRFEERIVDGEMHFDYQLKDGAASSRNAIKLLEIMGFDHEITKNAEKRARNYIDNGNW